MLELIAFDADDTLWHNITHFTVTHKRFSDLLAHYGDGDEIEKMLLDVEAGNLQYFGYGVKGFTLSMIETAIMLTKGRICGEDVQTIINYGKEMLRAPVELLDHVEDTLERLHRTYPLMIITKGDLFDQESKIAESGLAPYFQHIKILSDKNTDAYADILKEMNVEPSRFIMIGNSLKSDVLPVLELGGHGVHIPHHTTWEHEMVDSEAITGRHYHTLPTMKELPHLIHQL